MLETLDVRDGERILEIGTGTGYNAALLAHRLGDDNVFSLDIDSELVDTARQRLARIGRHPHLAAGDGAEGWPPHAPYHRILCTCAVRCIPAAWYDQLTPGGQLLVDFKPHGGNLVLLHKKADRLEGQFTTYYGAFMVMRQRVPPIGDVHHPSAAPVHRRQANPTTHRGQAHRRRRVLLRDRTHPTHKREPHRARGRTHTTLGRNRTRSPAMARLGRTRLGQSRHHGKTASVDSMAR